MKFVWHFSDNFACEKNNIYSSIYCLNYYIADDKKSCVPNCANINKFYFKGGKNCLDSNNKLINKKIC